MLLQRLIAITIMVIPGVFSAYGWSLMKNSYYSYLGNEGFLWDSFALGLLLFLGGIAFIGGFIFHRDRKRRLVQPRFLKKKK